MIINSQSGITLTSSGSASVDLLPFDSAGKVPRFVRVASTANGCFRVSPFGDLATFNDSAISPGEASVIATGGCRYISFISSGGKLNISALESGGWNTENQDTYLLNLATSVIQSNGGSAWYVPDDYSGIYTDSTGVTPVSAVGDVLGLLTDRSYGAGNLGPELVSLSSTWVILGTGISQDTASGTLSFTATPAGQFAKCGDYLVVGKTYLVEFELGAISGGSVSLKVGGGATTTPTSTPGTYRAVLKATQADGPYFWADAGPVTAVFTRVSVREVLGNHASQATTANKPIITRVPRRLGPELVTSGPVTLTAGIQQSITGSTIVSGRQYAITIPSGVMAAITSGWSVTGNGVQQVATANGTGVAQVYSAAGAGPFTPSIKEVLEWSNAIKFDGSNDLLTLSSGAVLSQASDHWVSAAFVLDAVTGVTQTIYATSSTTLTNPIITLDLHSTGKLIGYWRDNAGASKTCTSTTTLVAGVPYVATIAKVGINYTLWINGVLEATVSGAALGTTTVDTANIGTQNYGGSLNNRLNGKVIDLALGQSTLTDADRKTIERKMASRAGVTYWG